MSRARRMAVLGFAPVMIVVAFLLSGFYIHDGLVRSDRQTSLARRADETRALLFHLAALENMAEAGEPIDASEVDEVVAALGDRVEALSVEVAGGDELRRRTMDYATTARATALAFARGDTAEADELDEEEAEPLFEALTLAWTDVSAQAQLAAEAAAAESRRGLLIGGAAAVVATSLVVLIDARRRRRETEARVRTRADERFQALVDTSLEYIFVIDDDRRIVYSSKGTVTSADGRPAEVLTDLFEPLDETDADALVAAYEVADGDRRTQVSFLADEETRCFEVRVFDHRDHPSIGHRVLIAREVTESARLQRMLERQAVEDELTGLSNRRGLYSHLADALARGRRRQERVGLLLVDLDGFKGVNDTLGHPAGDDLLRQVAQRLLRSSRDGEKVCRLGGDEFAIVLEGIEPTDGPAAVCERYLDALRVPYSVEGEMLSILATVGLALSTGEVTVDILLSQADIALYEAKKRGGNSHALFEPAMQEAVNVAVRIEQEMRPAFDRGEFSLVYQPFIELDTQRLVGFEALMRWDSGLLGPVPPNTFIPAAERTGLIHVLGRWALKEACHQVTRWRHELDDPTLWMSVNVSVRQLTDGDILGDITAALEEADLEPSALQLEVTEGILVTDHELVSARLAAIQALGAKVALDDFGTGYSAMSQLQSLPVDTLKIDRSFVSALSDDDDRALSVIQALVRLGAALGLDVIAEGVEEPSQLIALRQQHCPVAQGYLFSRPMRPSELADYLRSHMSRTSADQDHR